MKPTLRRASAALLGAAVLAGSFASTAVAVDPEPSTLTLSFPAGTVQAHHVFVLEAQLDTLSGDFTTDASIDFAEVGHGNSCDNVAVGQPSQCTISGLNEGTHHFQATYSGNTSTVGSVSNDLVVVITADTVDATNVKVNYSTFYPVKDGYRDALTISGNRQESLAVTISIYNSNNKRVRLASKASAAGAYTYPWNGRNSKGDVLPAGKYRVVQRLVDTAGTAKSYASYVNLSTKKLVTLSKVITKNGSAISVQLGNAKVSGGTLRVKAGSGGAAGGGWQFKIPSAVIYKSISFRINAAAHLSAPPSQIAIQNFNTCTDWNTSCFDRWKGIGSSSGARRWYTTSGALSSHRNGHVVRGIVYVPQGTVYVYKAEVKVTYQILK